MLRQVTRTHLPPELEAFLEGGTPQSLTVRGAPGVGKTTFALTTLAGFHGARTMVTTRVPAEVLQRQFPWMSSAPGPAIDLVELVRFRSKVSVSTDSVEYLRETLQARASDLVDVSQVLNLPTELSEHLRTEPPPASRLIVIDSWEAWVENILGSSALHIDAPTTRWELERSMLDRLLSTGASVLMVVEREERTRFDYITDGAILLSATEVDGREERWLDITKLRGVRIRSRSYPFTLEGARFRAILRPTAWTIGPARSEPDPEQTAPSLWPGSAAFAEHFGRIPLGGPLLLEADAETPIRALWKLVAPIVESAYDGGGHAVLSLPNTLGPRDLWPTLSSFRAHPGIGKSIRVIVPSASPLPEDAPTGLFRYVELPPEQAAEVVSASLYGPDADSRSSNQECDRFDPVDFLRVHPGARFRNLVLVFPSTATDLGPEHRPDPYLLLPSRARRAGAEFSTVVVMRSDDPFLNEARIRAPVHLTARTRRGQLFLSGVRPWSLSLVLRPGSDDDAARQPYELIPIV